eukprot:CAMPEP_0182565978 /NCGR_PEP_ID=MMETSP1324-20130603/7569_1 /TAXON_ID=236786 /ORGANISM="Florenciella sp., Strain RCC1587" /LENGTH=61 /DNA_ID=CAMNT_0024779721 /DNA_START=1 /DNA_END=183 /DNA_ORIENTATION=-
MVVGLPYFQLCWAVRSTHTPGAVHANAGPRPVPPFSHTPRSPTAIAATLARRRRGRRESSE